MGSAYKHVFAPIKVRGVVFKNRIEFAPPSPNLASKDGKVTPEFVEFSGPLQRAVLQLLMSGTVSLISRRQMTKSASWISAAMTAFYR